MALRNIEVILKACGARLDDLVKMSVFLADMETFPAMNAAYLAVIGSDPPARITVGRAALALGAAVEIEGFSRDLHTPADDRAGPARQGPPARGA